jgi:hypothetical protein
MNKWETKILYLYSGQPLLLNSTDAVNFYKK